MLGTNDASTDILFVKKGDKNTLIFDQAEQYLSESAVERLSNDPQIHHSAKFEDKTIRLVENI